MKVLIIQPSMALYGGAETVIVHLANYLTSHGYTCDIATMGIHPDIVKDLKDSQILPIRKRWYLRNYHSYFENYDIINCHNFPATLITFGLYDLRPKLTWWCHEPPELFTSLVRKPFEFINRWYVRSDIRNVIVADEFNAKRFKRIYKVEPKIIPYGIDYDFWSQCQRQEHEGFNIIQVGTISPLKNQAESIRVFNEVKKTIPNCRLLLVGLDTSDYARQLKAGADSNVKFFGNVTRERLRELYSISDVLIHPVKGQGGWLTPFESISAGVPIVVNEDLTCYRLLEDFFPIHGGETSMAHSIKTHYKDNWLNQRVSMAREWIKIYLTYDKFGDRMRCYFQEVLS